MNNINFIKPYIFTKKLVLKQTPKHVSRWTPKINKSNKNNILLLIKHPSATKEWYNSINTFNKNNLKNLSIENNNLSKYKIERPREPGILPRVMTFISSL